MVAVGEPVYNTEQRREMLRQMKEYLDEQWLKKKAAGKLGKRIRLPNSKKEKPNSNKEKPKKRKRKRRIRLFKVIEGEKYGDQIVLKEIKIIKRKNRKYKNGRYFKRSDR